MLKLGCINSFKRWFMKSLFRWIGDEWQNKGFINLHLLDQLNCQKTLREKAIYSLAYQIKGINKKFKKKN